MLVVNGGRPRAVDLAREAAAWLGERGHDVRLSKQDAEAAGLHRLGVEPGELVEEGDAVLALALGGDGTILRTVHLVAGRDTPVLGVNLGRLAYLSNIEPDALCAALDSFLAGDFTVEERTMLSVTAAGTTRLALNEAVIEKNSPGHSVHLAVSIDGRPFARHVADAVILATPTGSTAYSFSAGGPIVSPRHQAVIITPVAPHTPFTRSLVLHPDEPVRVEVLDERGAVLSIDGQEVGRLAQGDTVDGQVALVRARFVTFGDRDFYGVLKAKFGLADR